MPQSILHVSLLVKDYDEAIAFYRDKLNFELIEDTRLSAEKRWVVIAPPGNSAMSLVLAKAQTPEERRQVGMQAGGRVFLFLHTDNFQRDYEQIQKNGVEFTRESETFDYGTVAVFADLYGNQWDLLEPSSNHAMYSRLKNHSE